MFLPTPDNILIIRNERYHVLAHPDAPTMAYGQAGKKATVYQLRRETPGATDNKLLALKHFILKYRSAHLENIARQLKPFASLPGLSACLHQVLTPALDTALLKKYPDLTYSVLMPWIQGTTWLSFLDFDFPLPDFP